MELILWLTTGAVAGAVAAFASPAAGARTRTLSSVAVGVVAALAGGLIVDAVVGAVATVRVTIISGGSFASAVFGLAPALAAAVAAVVVLASLDRAKASVSSQRNVPRAS